MSYQFKAAKGAQFSDKDAETFGPELVRIEKARGALTPSVVVEEAFRPESPLHGYFEWDDTRAAGHWRRQQARNLINSIEVIVEKGGSPEPVKYFFSVNTTKGRRYASAVEVMGSEDFRRQLLDEALGEIRLWEKRHRHLMELELIFTAIEETKKRLSA